MKSNKKVKLENWYISKNYLHFDTPISFKKASLIVKSPKIVGQHSFFPFLTFDVNSIRFKYDIEQNKKIRQVKTRGISYASHIDGHIYSYYSTLLSAKYEQIVKKKELHENILAFRKLDKKCNIDFAYQAFEDIKKIGECVVVALDFEKFFDTLNHTVLKKQWCDILGTRSLPKDHYNIYKSLTKFSKVDKKNIFKKFDIPKRNPKSTGKKRICSIEDFRNTVRKEGFIKQDGTKGIPQGSALSGLLSNIYMLDFDEKMKLFAEKNSGKYYRYCDDMLIIIPSSSITAKDIEDFAEKSSNELAVTLNKEKTVTCTFLKKHDRLITDKTLQYLGFIFDGENIYLRSSSISRYHHKMKRGISLAAKTVNKRNALRRERGYLNKNLYKNKLYERYSFLGKSNFVTYGQRAQNTMDSKTIKKQVKSFWTKLKTKLE